MTDIAEVPLAARRQSSVSLRKVLGTIHLWVGLTFSIPFAAIGLTGSLWMLVRDVPAPVMPSPAPAQTIEAYVAAAAAVAPEGARPVAFEAALGDRPAAVRFANPASGVVPAGPPGRGIRVTVDPATMTASVAPPPGRSFERLMHDIHGNLLISGGLGRQIVGWLGVFMVGLGFSGLVLWWPRPGQWKRAFSVKLSGGWMRASYDLHRFFGASMLIVFLIVCISGVYIVFPQAINAMGLAGPAVRDARQQALPAVTPREEGEALNADGVVALARAAVADGVLRTLILPGNPREPYRVTFSHADDSMTAPQVVVAVDPWLNQVTEVRDPDAYSANDKFLSWQRALHGGTPIGWGWWVLVFVSGLLPPLFAVTGVTLWWLRRRR